MCEGVGPFDAQFHERALALLSRSQVDLVSGSELLEGSTTEVSSVHRTIGRMRSWLLRVLVGFSGTDVHGTKVLRRATVLPVVQQCVVDGDAFMTELVVRAQRAGLDVREIPVRVAAPRPFSARCLVGIPRVLWDLAQLTYVIHFRRRER